MILNRRGFSLGEVLASLIALGIIALTVQSLILVAHNFLSQQSSSMSSLEEQTFFSKLVCHKFQRPVFVEQNLKRSFTYNPGAPGTPPAYQKRSNAKPDPKQNPATLSVPLLGGSQNPSGLSVNGHPAVQSFLTNLDSSGGLTASFGDTDKIFRAHINDEAAHFNNVDGASGSHSYYSQFYDIYADNHTLPTFMVKQAEQDTSKLGVVSEGFIYASRCIKNDVNPSGNGDPASFIEIKGDIPKYSIIDRTDNSNMNNDEVLATALYVLEQKWRPFYFPGQEKTKNKVICCDISQFDRPNTITLGPPPTPPASLTIPTGCANLEKYTPIIYVIKISSDKGKLEDLISGTDSNNSNDSLEGYIQNNVSRFVNNDQCESAIDPANNVDLSSTNCKTVASNSYFQTLGKGFAHPVKFENVEELPLVKRDRVNSWAYGFIAPSFSNQDMHKEFKIISIENKCHTSLPVGLCGKAVPGLDLSLSQNEINGKSVADYFIAKVSACPFHYITMDNSGGVLPLGLDRVQ